MLQATTSVPGLARLATFGRITHKVASCGSQRKVEGSIASGNGLKIRLEHGGEATVSVGLDGQIQGLMEAGICCKLKSPNLSHLVNILIADSNGMHMLHGNLTRGRVADCSPRRTSAAKQEASYQLWYNSPAQIGVIASSSECSACTKLYIVSSWWQIPNFLRRSG
ncbi:hypothetical protein DSO57_1039686 [Entomophthora muscae]|uniref:Uncharacterized protein n=1 Tax=Entomophthora muscae TaxID=34485 RepID=A0ACC2SWE0_9FUNG|nr:hypothetical protein DSO57_1039686 [Entomophthora muscae]